MDLDHLFGKTPLEIDIVVLQFTLKMKYLALGVIIVNSQFGLPSEHFIAPLPLTQTTPENSIDIARDTDISEIIIFGGFNLDLLLR